MPRTNVPRTPSGPRPSFNEFTVIGAFAVVAVFMLACGAFFALLEDDRVVPEAVVSAVTAPVTLTGPAPTEDAYQQEVAEVMAPFLGQAANVTQDDFAVGQAVFAELAGKTQERMLRVRVPKDMRDGHLALVLLLDQWKRALSGSSPDQQAVLAKTEEVIASQPWLRR